MTGAAGGLGRGHRRAARRRRGHVALLDLNGEDGGGSRDRWRRPGAGDCDVTEARGGRTGVVGEVAATFGGVDILVNNAGLLSGRCPFLEVDKEEMLRYYTTNVVGYLHMAQASFDLKESEHRGGS